MRFQRRARKGSRPEGLGHPDGTKHTSVSYRAKYLADTPNASLNRLLRVARMARREALA